MIPVLSKLEAQKLDEITINSGTKSAFNLMKSAGSKVAIWFMENIPSPFNKDILIIAGKGNNGGDGIVAHHYLIEYGIKSTLILMDKSELDRKLLLDYNIPKETVNIFDEDSPLPCHDWIIDSVFGIGLKRSVEGRFKNLITKMNLSKNIISVDIASGLFTDTGLAGGLSVNSKFTITMGYEKYAHYLNSGRSKSGGVTVVDIGFKTPDQSDFVIQKIQKCDINRIFKEVRHNIYKYAKGKVSIVAGSIGMSGAAILTSQGALRSGCGIIKLFTPDCINSEIKTNMPEIISFPLANIDDGIVSSIHLPVILENMYADSVLLIGPGLGNNIATSEAVGELIRSYNGRLVLDASGFNPLINGIINLDDLPDESILTPHYGEFSRLFGMDINEVCEDPIRSLQKVKDKIGNKIIILKGSPTFITSDTDQIYMVPNGLSLLATAGTGDVHSGMTAGFFAQNYSALESSILASFIHAETSQYYKKQIGSVGMTASDISYLISSTMESILNEN
jgi:ADP-dependent NAD(P)H-hydrate dehydratase / NAD(P)H-hydrate epimerase